MASHGCWCFFGGSESIQRFASISKVGTKLADGPGEFLVFRMWNSSVGRWNFKGNECIQ